MRDIFIEIKESIKRNKLRTALTGFSVSWGIFMLIVLLGAGNGLTNSMASGLGNVNLNTMDVQGGRTSKPYDGFQSRRRIRLEDKDVSITESEQFADVIDEVSPVVQVTSNVSYAKRYASSNIRGCYPNIFDMYKLKLVAGRFINNYDNEQKRKVLLIAQNLAESLFMIESNFDNAIGKRVKVGSSSYIVVGVYKTDESFMGYEAYAPFTTIKAMYSRGKRVDNVIFSYHGLESVEDSEDFEKEYRTVLNRFHRVDPTDNSAINISNHLSQNSQMEKGTRIIRVFLWIVGLFTLLSGIVGVSNIMLITVRERTHEFGIRKAIGARPWDVTKLIIAESITITAVFGYIGMVLGMIACKIMDLKVGSASIDFMGFKASVFVNPSVGLDVALEATLLLIIAGTVAGLVPAIKAARVRPIEALRADK
ncbi:MAG: ABC transporter permease [Bacteroidales bacterium]|nr:ABC transporter permease [Bacteroidales bacterium]